MVTIRKSKQQALVFDVQRYQQGGRTAYSLVMDLGTLDSTVPSFVNPDRIDRANRRFNATHSRKIAEYIYDIDDWVLGSIMLGIDPDYVEFVPYEDENRQPSESLGFIRIPLDGGSASIRILDGQHRRMAIQTVRERLRQEIYAQKNHPSNGLNRGLEKLKLKFERLDEMSIPVVLYEEGNTKELRQMFADLAKTRNIDAAAKVRFDERDPFNRAAVEFAEHERSDLLTGRIEMERRSPVQASNHLLSVSQLARCLKELKYGLGSRATRDRIRETENNYQELIDVGIIWADEFLPSARKEYEDLLSIELEEDFVAKNRTKSVFYNHSVTVLQLMAGCFYEWHVRRQPWQELSDWLREADLNVDSEECIFRQTGMVTTGTTGDAILISRQGLIKATIIHIVNQALLANS